MAAFIRQQQPLTACRRRSRTGVIAFAAIAVMLMADSALAWGPATHIQIATDVMQRLTLLPAALAVLLSRHAFAFVYGTIAADVVFAKRLSRVRQFCHHWSTGFKLLEDADTDESEAFAYGYLSHLAADTVAHGKYVPRQIALTNSTVGFGHLYWELRADALAAPPAHRRLGELLAEDHAVHHETMAGLLTDTLLPYDLNRVLFDRISAMAARRGSRRTMEIVSRCSRHELSGDLISRYRAECLDRTMSLLNEGHRCPLLREDPNGSGALMQSRVTRRDLRRLRRWGHPVEGYVKEMAASLDPPGTPASVQAGLSPYV